MQHVPKMSTILILQWTITANLVMSMVLCLWQLPLFGMREVFCRRHLRPASLLFQLLSATQLEPYHDPLVECG